MQSKNNKSKTNTSSAKKVEEQPSTESQTTVVAVENANKIVENKLQDQVVEVKKTRGKSTQQATSVVEPTPVVQATPVAQPAPTTESTPVVQTAGSKGKKTAKVAQVAQVAPVAPVAQVAPVAPATQTAGAKGKKTAKVAEAKQAEPATTAPAPTATKSTASTKSTAGKTTATKTATKVAPVAPVAQVAPVAPVVEQAAGAKSKKTAVNKVKAQVAQPVQQVAQEAEAEGDEKQAGNKMRYFKLYFNDEDKGRYCGKKPKQAANKAFSSIVKELNKNGENGGVDVDINYSVKECTRHSKHKEYKYVGKRESLHEAVPVYIPHEERKTKDKNSKEMLSNEELTKKILANASEQKQVSNVSIKRKKVVTLHSGKEVTTNGGAVFLLSESGQVFKKIIYHFHNKIQKAPKAPKVVEEQA
jgi:hypothetical protein